MAKKSIAKGSARGSIGTLILKALSSGDKYGYEIIKEVEESSNGTYTIKQPSLYSGLTRLEAKEFVSSYWRDSEIGGRRHYYKLTDAGIEKLANSKFEWGESKNFVSTLFEGQNKPEEKKEEKAEELIKEEPVKQQEEKAEMETPEMKVFNDNMPPHFKTEEDEEEVVFEKPQINPLQQDLFSIKQEPIKEEVKEETTVKAEVTVEEPVVETKPDEKAKTEEKKSPFIDFNSLKNSLKIKKSSYSDTHTQTPNTTQIASPKVELEKKQSVISPTKKQNFDIEEETVEPKRNYIFNKQEILKEKELEAEKLKEELDKHSVEEKSELDNLNFKDILDEFSYEKEEPKAFDNDYNNMVSTPGYTGADRRRNNINNVNIMLSPTKTTKTNYEGYDSSSFNNFEETLEKDFNSSYKPISDRTINESNESEAYLKEIYLKDVTVRSHKKKTTIEAPQLHTKYVNTNRLNLYRFAILSALILVETLVFFSTTSAFSPYWLFMLVGGVALLNIINIVKHNIFPNRRDLIKFHFKNNLINSAFIVVILCLAIYSYNLFIGMNSLNATDYSSTFMFPIILSLNIILSPIIKHYLLKLKSLYY